MKIPVHVLAVRTANSQHVYTSLHGSVEEVRSFLLETHQEEFDPDFEDGLDGETFERFVAEIEAHLSLDITHDVQEIEVPAQVADPTTLVEYVAKARHERYRTQHAGAVAEVLDKPWDNLLPTVKQMAKQECVEQVYDVLHALSAVGTIGGIANG